MRDQTPDQGRAWFRDAKFGIWSHWGPQSVPGRGDWYARRMYRSKAAETADTTSPVPPARGFHEEHYGHPSRFGHKDVCNLWKAERWDPAELMDLFVRCGARYFVSMGNHIDNLDLWESRHQPWNAARVGPQRDVVREWARAARARDLPFGISFHANWTWKLMDVAFGADDSGPMAGVPYDGNLTAADGRGTWWEGLDPADLYGRKRDGAVPPDVAQAEDYYRRVWDAFERYLPEYVYFDDSRLPFDEGSICRTQPASRLGWQTLERMHHASAQAHGGASRLVATVKRLQPTDGEALTLDVERAQLVRPMATPWQLDTCLGHWFYQDEIDYKSARQVIAMLVDTVSKNGTLLLSVPQRGDGTIDETERAILEEIGRWLDRNGSAIYDTRPWVVHGEGPTQGATGDADRFRERDLPYTGADIRFTANDDVVYAVVLAWPNDGVARIHSMGRDAALLHRTPAAVRLLDGGAPLPWEQTRESLEVRLPDALTGRYAIALAIHTA